MGKDSTTKFIGLDVHAKTISVAIADEGRKGEVSQRQGEIIRDLTKQPEGRQKDVDKIVKTLFKEFIKSGNELGG